MQWGIFRFVQIVFFLILLAIFFIACSYVEPILSVNVADNSTIEFSDNSQKLMLQLSNLGASELSWAGQVSDFKKDNQRTEQWLSISERIGQLSYYEYQQLSLSRGVMYPGEYSAKLMFEYPYNGNFANVEYSVAATVSEAPRVVINSSFDTLDVALGQTKFYLQNGTYSKEPLEWSIETMPNWLDIQPKQGRLEGGEQQLLQLSFNPQKLEVGTYKAEIGFLENNFSSFSMPVQATYTGCTDNVKQNAIQNSLTKQFNVSKKTEQKRYVEQQLLVRYVHMEDRKLLLRDYSRYGLKLLVDGRGNVPDLVSVNRDIEEVEQLLKADSRIEHVQLNYYLQSLTHDFDFPNDEYLEQQWYLDQFGVAEGWEMIDIKQQANQQPIIVAVIDSGVDIAHADLVANLVPGCDLRTLDSTVDNDPRSKIDKHGTHVAGIVAAVSNNGIGTTGLSYLSNVKVQPIKIFGDNDEAPTIYDAANAIRWAAGLPIPNALLNQTPADIINFSVGQSLEVLGTQAAFELNYAVADALAAGKIFVSSAGNDSKNSGGGVFSPANAPGAISVGSIDGDWQRSSFSRYDRTGIDTVDVVAPGGSSVTSQATVCGDSSNSTSIVSTFPNGQYGCQAGTSMAAPYVSGVLALIWAQNPDWTARQVEQRLFHSTYFDDSWIGKENEYGRGLVCLDKALGAKTRCGR